MISKIQMNDNSQPAFKSTIALSKDLAKSGTNELIQGLKDAAQQLKKDGLSDEFVLTKGEYRKFNEFNNGTGTGFYTKANGLLLILKDNKCASIKNTIYQKIESFKKFMNSPLIYGSNMQTHEEEINAFNPPNMQVLCDTTDISKSIIDGAKKLQKKISDKTQYNKSIEQDTKNADYSNFIKREEEFQTNKN